MADRTFASKFYISCQHFKIRIFYCSKPNIYHFENGMGRPHGASVPIGSIRLPLFAGHAPFSAACPVSSHEPPLTPRPDPAACAASHTDHETMSALPAGELHPPHRPTSCSLPISQLVAVPSWCRKPWVHLHTTLSLRLDFQLVSTPIQLLPPYRSRI